VVGFLESPTNRVLMTHAIPSDQPIARSPELGAKYDKMTMFLKKGRHAEWNVHYKWSVNYNGRHRLSVTNLYLRRLTIAGSATDTT